MNYKCLSHESLATRTEVKSGEKQDIQSEQNLIWVHLSLIHFGPEQNTLASRVEGKEEFFRLSPRENNNHNNDSSDYYLIFKILQRWVRFIQQTSFCLLYILPNKFKLPIDLKGNGFLRNKACILLSYLLWIFQRVNVLWPLLIFNWLHVLARSHAGSESLL